MTTASPRRRASPGTRWSVYRRWVQWGVLAVALIGASRFVTVPGARSPEAYCPFGAIETAASLAAGFSFLRQISLTNGIVLGLVALSALVLGRIFCGWACPIGALSDASAWLSRKLFGRQGPYPLQVPRALDRPLRWLKVVVLGWVLWASLSAVVPPLAPYCPFRTLFEFDLGSMLSWALIATLFLLSMIVERFWCRYLCPLGAILAPLNWLSPVRPRVNRAACVACGRCKAACPAGIDPVADGTEHLECVRCYACVQACGKIGALRFRRAAKDR